MNGVNRAMGGIFDVLLAPLERLGVEWALVIVSCIGGILGLICFKYISYQKGIKGVKDKLKGNVIAIRIFQDDLVVVFKSCMAVLPRTVQYLGLNFGPIVPLLVPFVLVLAQLVVRYAYDPLPVVSEARAEAMLPGEGTMLTVQLRKEHAPRANELEIELPEGIRALTPVVRSTSEGWARVEIVAVAPVAGDIEVSLAGQPLGTKAVVAGDEPSRRMQPLKTASFWESWMYPAEEAFAAEDLLAKVEFLYPERELRYLMGGELGILLVFFAFSMAAGFAILKPLNIQI